MLRYRQPINNESLADAYKFIYSIASFAFTLTTIFTLPLLQQEQSITAYCFFLRVSAVCMIIGEIMELGVDPVPKWSVVLCVIGVLGNILYICCSIIYEYFNKGELYIIAMFCTTLAMQLKILCIITQESRNNSYLYQYEKSRLIKIGSILIGTMLFLTSTILQQLEMQDQDSLAVAGINVIGGCMFAVSSYVVLQKQNHVGYAVFDHSMEIPTII